jgi:hypothetical protein
MNLKVYALQVGSENIHLAEFSSSVVPDKGDILNWVGDLNKNLGPMTLMVERRTFGLKSEGWGDGVSIYCWQITDAKTIRESYERLAASKNVIPFTKQK